MDWIVGLVTCVAIALVASRRWYGWAVGLVAQGLWLWLILTELRRWGLLLPAIVIAITHAVALFDWWRTERKRSSLRLSPPRPWSPTRRGGW